jgi:hypothetical protein
MRKSAGAGLEKINGAKELEKREIVVLSIPS